VAYVLAVSLWRSSSCCWSLRQLVGCASGRVALRLTRRRICGCGPRSRASPTPSTASGNLCRFDGCGPPDDLAELGVGDAAVSPGDVAADHAGLLAVAGVVGAVDREVPQCGDGCPRRCRSPGPEHARTSPLLGEDRNRRHEPGVNQSTAGAYRPACHQTRRTLQAAVLGVLVSLPGPSGYRWCARSRSALVMTLTEESAIAAAAIIGESRSPTAG